MRRLAFIRRTLAIIVASGLLVAASASLDDIILKRRPKVGDTAQYTISAEFDSESGTIKFGEKETSKITDVSPDGSFKELVSASDITIEVPGIQIPAPPDSSYTAEYLASGLTKALTGEMAPDSSSYRLSHLNDFEAPDAPVKVGDVIKFDIPADKDKDTPAVHAEYTVAGFEKVGDWDTAKLTFSAKETEGTAPSTISGTVWISTADGSVVKMDGLWKDVQPQGVPMPLSGKYHMDRTK